MSGSDSESLSSASVPDDETIEQGLRDVVANIFQKGTLDDLTVKRVRAATEKSLGLDEGFFKGDESWKPRSDAVIKQEADAQEALQEKKKNAPKSKPAAPKRPSPPKKTKPTKRPATDTTQETKKRRKQNTVPESGSDLSSALSDAGSGADEELKAAPQSPAPSRPKKPSKGNKTAIKKFQVPRVMTEDTVNSESEPEAPGDPESKAAVGKDNGASESEMSVLIDEEPKPKSKSRGTREKPSRAPQAKQKKAHASKDSNLEPDQAEIKRLQGWLIKCGIRKIWSRELAPYDAPKAKIRHLKQMLKDAGMEGRYSVEKAKSIKEERELKADLEGVQEGAKRWGAAASSEEPEEVADRPRRRLARGFRSLNFLDDEDEESD